MRILKRYEEIVGTIRNNGIYVGEMSTEDTRQSMFTKETQRLDQLKWTEDSEQLLEDLMGKDVQPRKEFVFNKIDFEKYGEV